MTTVHPAPASPSTAELAAELAAATRGRVHGPDEPDAAVGLTGFNLAVVHHPELVLAAEDAADVAAAVRIAARTGRRVAVMATGHSAEATGPGTILVTTAGLDELTVDPGVRTARVGAGVRWQQVLDAAAPHGLAGLSGSAPGVSVIGYTTGGGMGPTARAFGFAADHVRQMEVVTADGEIRQVDARSEPDLFWALRGGGAAFGIVTAMTFDLLPVPTFFGGGIFFAAADAPAVLPAWRAWTDSLPDEAGTSVARLNLPPDPALPPPLQGRAVVHLRFAFVGPTDEGERLIAPMRGVAPALADMVGELPYAAIGAVHMDPVDPVPAIERGTLLAELPDAALDAFLDATAPGGLPIMMAELRLLGGAVARPPVVPDAVGGRTSPFAFEVVGILAPPIADQVPGAVDAVMDRLAPWSTGAALLNFAGTPEGIPGERARRAWPAADFERLVALRAAVDPQGVFAPAARWTVA